MLWFRRMPVTTEHEIGRVVAVDTAQVTVELNRDLKALTRSTYEGTIEVGRINSYIIIPVGSHRIVGMVTRVVMSEENELQADKMMVSLPSTRRLMKATMIGSISDTGFRQGINLFPVLDSKVFLTTRGDLDAIFGTGHKVADIIPETPGYCVHIGKSVVFPDYKIYVDPDALFGKHAAIIGSTGSGKSCSIATILQSIISRNDIKRTRIVILDTNGEYRAAFEKRNDDGTYKNAIPDRRTLYIPTDSTEPGRLTIPYWFMDSEDFVRLFRAAPGVQRPVLLNALTLGRQEGAGPQWTFLRDTLMQECHRILALTATGTWQDRNNINAICDGVISALASSQNQDPLQDLLGQYPSLQTTAPSTTFQQVKAVAGRQGQSYDPLNMAQRQQAEGMLSGLISSLAAVPMSGMEGGSSSADRPSYFGKTAFRYRHLETAMSRDQSNSARARDNCSTMLTRIYRLLEDSRFEFLFGPCSEEWPTLRHGLATFLRDVLGLESSAEAELMETDGLADGILPFYDRQRKDVDAANVVIVDLSLLASEVLENVTALIGRLIHEFLQRLSDPVSGVGRGEFPVILVLEEAQNYIREGRKSEEDSISKQVFERIAREGRKFGLGLVVASQRPSELSKTVLSQCNSFIVHRLQNPEDLRYFREIVPGIYGQLLDQLPALAPRSALVLGECVKAPVLVEMREADPTPRSKNPQFYKSWTGETPMPDVEAVCAKWEGQDTLADDEQGEAG
jgi:ABC-type dipeptide/oligopeptide/nickel transport system ATPase component